jgi:hypothetical protein
MKGKSWNHIPAIVRTLPGAAERMVERMTVDIAAQAGATAPIDTGALAESYTAEVEGKTGTAGTNMEYGPHVEYGTVNTPAQPHLVPAFDNVADAAPQYVEQFGDEIVEAAKRG